MSGAEPLLAFDIETVPDTEALRAEYGMPDDAEDGEVYEFVCRRRRQEGQPEFLPVALHKVAVISCAMLERRRPEPKFRVFSLETCSEGEGKVIMRFFDGIDKFEPQLLSWNGKGFDMPVLHHRGLLHGVVSPTYWDADGKRKWNNYISRFHSQHLDIMDALAQHARRAAKLDTVSRQCGLPGKMGMDGGQVWGAWQQGKFDDIRFYCETDAVNTLLVGLAFERMRGAVSDKDCRSCRGTVLESLRQNGEPRWSEYLARVTEPAAA